MGDESLDGVEQDAPGRVSRRAALKAGVAAGIGAAAWSGASITSLGGTPAYAQGCTFAARFDLVTCRNTDQGAGGGCTKKFRYHVLGDQLLPGFSITNNITEGTCCDPGYGVNGTSPPVFNFPSNLYCIVELVLANPSNCSGTEHGRVLLGAGTGGSFPIDLACPGDSGFPTIPSQAQYRITATCVTNGTQCECFNIGC